MVNVVVAHVQAFRRLGAVDPARPSHAGGSEPVLSSEIPAAVARRLLPMTVIGASIETMNVEWK